MLEREPGFINAVKRLRLEKQALPVLKKRVMEAADGNRSFNYENEWLRNAVDAMPPDEQEAFIGSYWTKSQRSRNRSNNDWELRERAQLLAGFGCVPAFRYAVEAAMRQDRNNYLQRLLALSACPSMEEFVVWFRDNRDNLVFDSEEGIYKAAPPRQLRRRSESGGGSAPADQRGRFRPRRIRRRAAAEPLPARCQRIAAATMSRAGSMQAATLRKNQARLTAGTR